MAATDLASIIAAWRLVLEADPLNLKRTRAAFTHDRQPNKLVADSYRIEDGGQVNRTQGSSYFEARIDRLRIWVTKPIAFASDEQFTAMEQLADTVYRYLSA